MNRQMMNARIAVERIYEMVASYREVKRADIIDICEMVLSEPVPCHRDPTGKTREPPHCPTCCCGTD